MEKKLINKLKFLAEQIKKNECYIEENIESIEIRECWYIDLINIIAECEGNKLSDTGKQQLQQLDFSDSSTFPYLRSEYNQQLKRLKKLGINIEGQFFEKSINSVIYLAEITANGCVRNCRFNAICCCMQ